MSTFIVKLKVLGCPPNNNESITLTSNNDGSKKLTKKALLLKIS